MLPLTGGPSFLPLAGLTMLVAGGALAWRVVR
jgi:LPXTG-motif cell wall-anchored protein